VCPKLRNSKQREELTVETSREYTHLRELILAGKNQGIRLSLKDARANRLEIEWRREDVTRPSFLGVRVFDDFSLDEIRRHIDWTPFFWVWDFKGKYPDLLTDPERGKEAEAIFRDAQDMMERIVRGRVLPAKGVAGFFPAHANGDDIEIYADDRRSDVRAVLHTLRQQAVKAGEEAGQPHLALADFIAPKGSGIDDYIGMFAVTSGLGLNDFLRQFEKVHDDYQMILAKALADRLAEAFAEALHEKVRKELWGYAPDETLTTAQLFEGRYRGIRPAPGYPVCPDHTQKRLLFDLLDAERHTGIHLTETLMMDPAASVCGFYFAHPQARYFWLGKIGKDQVEDLARRKGVTAAEIEKWLGPNLAY
jgi:5-methyltetrahydrofolate--homocysteine methyltransferase